MRLRFAPQALISPADAGLGNPPKEDHHWQRFGHLKICMPGGALENGPSRGSPTLSKFTTVNSNLQP
jgi:hypothetical protein